MPFSRDRYRNLGAGVLSKDSQRDLSGLLMTEFRPLVPVAPCCPISARSELSPIAS
jgi:hypothetical protein